MMSDRLAATTEDSRRPLYHRFAANLREHISKHDLSPGSALPSERELSANMGLSRVTVRRAIDMLIEEGLLFRRQGAGTFVSASLDAQGPVLRSFSDDARSHGLDPSAIWIIRTHAAPTDEEALALEIPSSEKVARLGRVRLAGGEPLAIEHAVVPATVLPDLDAIGDSLYAALDARGLRPMSGTQRICASLANPTEAGILSIEAGAPILRIERLGRAANGVVVELTRSAYRGDRYDFVTDLRQPHYQA